VANLQLIRVVQQFPAFGALLDELWAEWRPLRLVHYDLKWDNLLVVRSGRRARPRLKIVDWELAGLGDPCWDAGAVFGEYLRCWAGSIPANGEGQPGTLLALARYPLARMQPAICSFWRAYTAALGLDPPTATVWLCRAVRFAAGRLTQTAFEEGQDQPWLTTHALLLLQLAFNILQRPDEAATKLLGLSTGAEPDA
jgi:aminoglycoside phosphotransferase (APT) family kinase protein